MGRKSGGTMVGGERFLSCRGARTALKGTKRALKMGRMIEIMAGDLDGEIDGNEL
jgi:hypothetical protein